MPIERASIETSFTGKVENQIQALLSDGNGYYFSEIHAKVKCGENYLRRVIAKLKDSDIIKSKPIPIKMPIKFAKARMYFFVIFSSKLKVS